MKNTSRKTVPRSLRFVCVAMWLLATISTSLLAQYRASLQGTVTDPTGAVVPNATVTLTSKETNISKTATTDASGVYSIPGLAPATYSLSAEAPGFQKTTLDSVVIASEQAQSQNVQLQSLAQATTTVTVSGTEAPAIDTETATISGTLTGQQVEALPTFGRDPFQAALLAPGTFGDDAHSAGGGSQNLPGSAGPGGTSNTSSVFQTENQVQIVANGTRNNSNSFQVDGIEINSLAWGGAAVITPNEESVKEVTVQSSPYDASNGRNSGAQVMVVSKNGTNELHGSGVFKAARPGLNADQRWAGPFAPTANTKDTDRFNQWAGSIGGPVIKNHLFFFFSYETLLNSAATLSAPTWFETPQFLSAAQSANPSSIASKVAGFPGEGAAVAVMVPVSCAVAGFTVPGTCQQVSGGLDIGSPLKGVPLGTMDPTYVSGGQPGVGGGLDGVPDIMEVETRNPTSQNPQQYNGRMDFQATQRDLIAFTTYYVPNDSTFYNGPARPANLWHSDRLNEAATLLWDRTISSTWLNEARGGVTRWHYNEVTSNPQEPWGLPQENIDTMGAAGVQFLGAPGPGVFYQTTFNFRDTLSTTKGNHSIKMGADLYWEQDNDTEAFAARPTYSFRNLWDFANDAPYSESGNFNPLTGRPTSATKYIRSQIYAGFIQDDYKLKPNLTLNLGLRWEYFTPLMEKYGNISNVLLGSGPDPLLGVHIKVGGDLYNSSKNNWGPQLGFAWTPGTQQRFVIRGGFGIGYNRMEEAITLNGRGNPPLVTSLNLLSTSTAATTAPIVYAVPGSTTGANAFYNWPVNPAAMQTFNSAGLPANGAPVTLTGFQENLPTPIVYRYSLDPEYNLGGNWVAKLGYQASLSRHYTRQQNLNWVYFPLVPQIQSLTFYTNDANASYNAMLAELQHQFGRSGQFDIQYRWSHTIDDGSNDYYTGEYPYALQYLKGDADYDVRHNIKIWGAWTPHFGKVNGWVDKVLGGWEITGIVTWHSGYPWTPVYGNYGCNIVYYGSGYCNLRPAAYLGGRGMDFSNSAFESGPNPTNPTAFNNNFSKGALAYFTVPNYVAATMAGQYVGIPPAPSVGRNVLRGPDFLGDDFSLQKSFGLPKMPLLGENARFDFRADFYNLFNKLNLNPGSISNIISFDGTTPNPSFGQAQSALAARIIQFQVRFSF